MFETGAAAFRATQNGGLVNEVLRFDGPLMVEGHGTYLEDADPGA